MGFLINLSRCRLETFYFQTARGKVVDMERRSPVVNCFAKWLTQGGLGMLTTYLELCCNYELAVILKYFIIK